MATEVQETVEETPVVETNALTSQIEPLAEQLPDPANALLVEGQRRRLR